MKKIIIFALFAVITATSAAQMRQIDAFQLSSKLDGINLKTGYYNLSKKDNHVTITLRLSPNSKYELGVTNKGENITFKMNYGETTTVVSGNLQKISIETGSEQYELVITFYPPTDKKAGVAYALNYLGTK